MDSVYSLRDVKKALREGEYVWPGGYPRYFVTRDGAALSFKAVHEEFAQVVWDFVHDTSTGWRIIGCEINYEDANLLCDHTNERIPSAYAES